MPECPHWYVVHNSNMSAKDTKLFFALVEYSRRHGYIDYYGTLKGLYLDIGNGHKIWTMGAPVQETTILNIAAREHGTKNVYLDPNAGIW